MSDLSCIPITALSLETKNLLGTHLNPLKVLPSRNGSLRDWRGLAKICSIESEFLPALVSDADPFNRILSIIQQRSQNFMVKNLIEALEEIDRWDTIDDSHPFIVEDAEAYLKRPKGHAVVNDFTAEKEVLTLDDRIRIQEGKELQHYDAFVLHDDEDSALVDEIVENLEEKNNMKLCIKNRDLLVGIKIEHKAIADLIYNRCNRIIVIISPNLFNDPNNGYFINFAQATAIEKRQERKIIPCIYEHCNIPPELAFFSKIDFKRLKREYFWNRLIASVRSVTDSATRQESSNPPTKTSTINAVQNGAISSLEDRSSSELSSPKYSSVEFCNQSKKAVCQSSTGISRDDGSLANQSSEVLPKLPSIDGVYCLSSETMPKLPSIDGVDSLPPQTQTKLKPKSNKNKSQKNYLKKIQSFLKKY